MATAGSIVIDLLMKTGAFETDSKRAEKRLKELQKTAKQFGVAVGAAVVTASTALATVTAQAIQFADQIDHFSTQLGISTETLSGWAYATGQAGTSFESLTRGIPRLSKALADAQDEGSRLNNLFQALDVSTKDAEGNLRSVEDVLPDIADRFKDIESETTRTALAMELFGRSGAEMAEFLALGSDGIRELTDRAAELGVVVGDETAANAAKFNDRMDDLRSLATALGLQLADRLLPAMTELVEEFRDFVVVGDGAEQIASGLESAFSGVATGATILSATIKGVVHDLLALYHTVEAMRQLTVFGFGDGKSFSGEMDIASGERRAAAGYSDTIADALAGNGSRRNAPITWIDPPAARGRARDSDIARFLVDPTGSGGGGGKARVSEAEKEAQRLQQAYESMVESLDRQRFMLGKVGEEAQVRYEIEMGALKELAPELQNQLLAKAALLDAEIQASEKAKERAEEAKREEEAFERMNAQILEQIELIGMSADEQEIYLNLAWAGVEAESERGRQIIENTKLLQIQREEMEQQIEFMDGLRDAARGFRDDLYEGVGVWDALRNAADRFADTLFKMASDGLIDRLFGKQGDPAGGSFGDSILGLFGSWFGGGRAGGGDVLDKRAYLVGEQGPEMFVPRTAGAVLDAQQTAVAMGGARGMSIGKIEMHTHGATSRRSVERQRVDLNRELSKAARTFG